MALKKRSSGAALREKIRLLSEKTKQTHIEVTEKRAKKRSKKAQVEDTPAPSEKTEFVIGQQSLETASDTSRKSTAGQTDNDVVNWKHVHDWFRDGIIRNNRSWLAEKKVSYRDRKERKSQAAGWGALAWTGAEIKCTNLLLSRYGADILEKTVEWMCDNWQTLKDNSNGGLMGAPSVRLLWSQRERFFPEAMEGKVVRKRPLPKKVRVKKHMVGEYNAESASKSPRVGWRKDV